MLNYILSLCDITRWLRPYQNGTMSEKCGIDTQDTKTRMRLVPTPPTHLLSKPNQSRT